jgi:hypothetical protein
MSGVHLRKVADYVRIPSSAKCYHPAVAGHVVQCDHRNWAARTCQGRIQLSFTPPRAQPPVLVWAF